MGKGKALFFLCSKWSSIHLICLIIFLFFWEHRGNLFTFKNSIKLRNIISMQLIDLSFISFDSIYIFFCFCYINAAS